MEHQSQHFSDATKDQRIAYLEEKLRVRDLKLKRQRRPKPHETVHPADDPTFRQARACRDFRGARGVVAAVLRHGGTKNLLTYMDPGPHPNGKTERGWVNTPGCTFERDMWKVAADYGLELPPAFVHEAASRWERRVDKRFESVHSRLHSAINSIAYLLLREDEPEPQWWPLYPTQEDVARAKEYPNLCVADEATCNTPTDATDGCGSTSEEENEDAGDFQVIDGSAEDAPPEYYDDDPPDEDDEDGVVAEDDELLDELEDEHGEESEDEDDQAEAEDEDEDEDE